MKVLTVYAPRSFCHAVLERFSVYFYEVAVGDPATVQGYLRRSYELGRDFAVDGAAAHA